MGYNKLEWRLALLTLGRALTRLLRHQDHSKWRSTRRNLQKCFPNLRQLDFAAGNTPEFDDQKVQQGQPEDERELRVRLFSLPLSFTGGGPGGLELDANAKYLSV